jgi:methyl coenzyme M reductase gamma subunit
MLKVSEIEDWRSKAIRYRNLAAQAGTHATRTMLEDLARETEEIAKELIETILDHEMICRDSTRDRPRKTAPPSKRV